ncbi:SAM-dependent methyltransferase [Litchfieldia alkalitelluris]|uniref:SAM-dependent methyltransferase n=1 Tax=Litchfieldia alkalitelluris TaxID=304268 RepID=UPI0009962B97|nr:SAM-dependent methyltransferase [Litchfieldia alkalitelluris]
MSVITLNPIGFVFNEREVIEDDHWGNVISRIKISESFNEDCINEIDTFSHLEIIYYFHMVEDDKIVTDARHPRNNKNLPKVGIFAQRGKNRPNRIGLTTVKLVKKEGRELYVQGLDCINGTPVLDIKPVMKEFLPRETISQPDWSREIMKNYWN